MYTVLHNRVNGLYWPVECSDLQKLYIQFPYQYWEYPYYRNGLGLVTAQTAKEACDWADYLEKYSGDTAICTFK